MSKNKLSTSSLAQRERLLKWLQRNGSITTIEARSKLDIMMPASRIFELKNIEGHDIRLHWVQEQTDQGVTHRIGKYTLHGGVTK